VTLFDPASIGAVRLSNRIIRSATSETMATRTGDVTDELISLYRTLAEGDVGLMFAGQMFCEDRGRFGFAQTGIHSAEMMAGLSRLTEAVHGAGGLIFAQLAHAGNQSLVTELQLVAPSAGPNAMTGHTAPAATDDEIWKAVGSFAAAAQRALDAGFDGVHIHGANGYLISSFMSPLSNTRDDDWGGDPESRGRLALEVVRAVRAVVPDGYPVTMKLGLVDEMAGGLALPESLVRARNLVDAGVDAIEVSSNLAMSYSFSARPYAGVTRGQAAGDLLVHRLLSRPRPEAYFRPLAAELSRAVEAKVILTGGLRRRATMESVLSSGDSDFVGIGRPFIREPDLVKRLRAEDGAAACTSCNICAMHDEYHSLRCWRYPRRNLAEHAVFRLSGGFR
jgi:2,4-dienoyl-CoA reductase-like NADH-dependent reductase (Old Yellow Enzyme family)